MAEGQVGDGYLLAHTEGFPETLKHGVSCEQDVVVRDHHSLGRPGGATGVNEQAAVARLLSRCAGIEISLGNVFTELEERVPAVDGSMWSFFVHGSLGTIHHDGLEPRQLAPNGLELGQLRLILDNNDSRLAVISDIRARIGAVGCVDPGSLASSEDRSIVGKKPFRGIEADNVDGLVLLEADLDQGLREANSFIVVLLPGELPPLPLASFLAQRHSSAGLRDSFLENLDHSHWWNRSDP
mmetsp:Transcript_18291/g.42994  ORF Transcript_18291/g.42994 Transcript_18291/m.42994 type:complete len:240 (-) Transcript_18291:275-994(-)